MHDAWIAERMSRIDASGIRKAFELARKLKDPINLSIGLPDFQPPEAALKAAAHAIASGANAYTVTQGIPELVGPLQARVDAEYGHPDRQVLITAGSSGALTLALACVVNPGEEVVLFDPGFTMYRHLTTLAGGACVMVDTYPDFRPTAARVEAVLSPRTKCVIVNSPGNPTGQVATATELEDLADLCRRRGILLISDEVYRSFCHDGPFVSPARFNEDVLVVDGFSKSHGMTGWRLGFAHGPRRLIQEMAKLQQFTFICAPSIAQHGGAAALDHDLRPQADAYRRKRDMVVEALTGQYDLPRPEGAFYAFPRAPWGTGAEFTAKAIEHNLLVIPGGVFSARDSHFRISFAVADETLARGLALLRELAQR